MKGEQGFTLVELLVTIAITGFIVTVIGMAINHIVTVPEYGNDRITAMHEVQNVAHWFGIDGQMAKAAVGGNQLTLTLYDDSTITYSMDGTDLNRVAGTSIRTLAQNITDITFSVLNGIITMDIASSPSARWSVSQNGTYEVCMRPVQQ